MAGGDLLVDRLVARGFLRPAVLLRGLQLRRPALSCWRVGLVMGLSGLAAQTLDSLGTPNVDDAPAADRRGALGSE